MKRFLFFALAVIMFAACSKDAINEQQSIQNIVDEAPETITVGFEGDETRIQLNSAQKTVWTKGDLVSVFYRSNANQQWKYDGETGARTAELKRVDAGTATHDMDRVVVVYPYNENYYINPKTYNVQASLPAVQNYLKDSYGTNGNIMISSSEYNQFSLKSVCGWLKLQLTGDGEVVKSITLRGNNGEQVAGELYINSADATSILASASGATDDDSEAGGSLIFEDTILKEVTLDCGEGVELGAEATAFYIALPPQTFDGGITVEITATNGLVMTKSTDNEVVIERNCIQPMTAFGYNGIFTNNEIYYTNGSTTEPTAPNKPDAFGDATIQSNTYDAEKECWVITFDKDVTEIGQHAFSSCYYLTSVTIPDSVTTIGYYAFYDCTSLTSVTIPDSVTTIGENAFCNCISLTSVTIPDSVTTIGGTAFAQCTSLTSVTIPDSVTTIGIYAFGDCESLASVTIPDSVTTIGDSAFEGCDSLTSVNIPDSVTTIGNGAFYWCTSLTSVTIGDSVTTIGDYAFCNCGSLTSVTIPDSVTTIGGCAFAYCKSLKEFKGKFAADNGRCLIMDNTIIAYAEASGTTYTIPDSVTTIGEAAFEQCTSLTSVTIPDSVMTIGWGAFRGCSSLTSVTIGDSVTEIRSGAFYNCYSLTEFTGKFAEDNGRILVVDGVLTAFAPAGITEYNIPDSVTSIIGYAFTGCDSLTSVNIPDSVTTIGGAAFYDCDSLTSVTIGNSVTTIGDMAFSSCYYLTSVTIGDSVTTIGNQAFSYCFSLTSVYCKATTPPGLGNSYVFGDNGSGRKIYVPAGSVDAYKSATYWSEYASAIVGYDFETGVVVE